MNKKLLIGSITAALVLGGTFAVGASELPIFDLKTNKEKYEKQFIPAEQAKTIALNEVNGTVEDVEIEKENGYFYYEVEIDKDNIDYDVFIEAYTGKIAHIRIENDDNNIKIANKVERDDQHDDGTKKVTIENKQQAPSTSKPAVTKNQQVHDDDNDDDDWDDRDDRDDDRNDDDDHHDDDIRDDNDDDGDDDE